MGVLEVDGAAVAPPSAVDYGAVESQQPALAERHSARGLVAAAPLLAGTQVRALGGVQGDVGAVGAPLRAPGLSPLGTAAARPRALDAGPGGPLPRGRAVHPVAGLLRGRGRPEVLAGGERQLGLGLAVDTAHRALPQAGGAARRRAAGEGRGIVPGGGDA